MVDGRKSGLNWYNCCAGCVRPSNVISFYIVIAEPAAALSVPHLPHLGWSILMATLLMLPTNMRVHGKTETD